MTLQSCLVKFPMTVWCKLHVLCWHFILTFLFDIFCRLPTCHFIQPHGCNMNKICWSREGLVSWAQIQSADQATSILNLIASSWKLKPDDDDIGVIRRSEGKLWRSQSSELHQRILSHSESVYVLPITYPLYYELRCLSEISFCGR